MDCTFYAKLTTLFIITIATNIGVKAKANNEKSIHQCIFIFHLKPNMSTLSSRTDEKPSSLTINYDKKNFICFNCSNNNRTLIPSSNFQRFGNSATKVCQINCNGIMCGGEKSCKQARELKDDKLKELKCKGSRITQGQNPAQPPRQSNNQAPLFIGFGVGGLMLAVVIAGVFLGRSRTAGSPNESDVATTPVSMSYSEWISNNSNGGRGVKGSNLRVQEAVGLQEDMEPPPVPVYSIVYEDNNNTYAAMERYHDNEATIIEVDGLGGMDDTRFASMKNNNRNIRQVFSPYKDMDYDESPHGTLTLTGYQPCSDDNHFGEFGNKLETNNNKINACDRIWGDYYDDGQVYQMFSNSFVTNEEAESESVTSLYNARNSTSWSDDDSRSKIYTEHDQSLVYSEQSRNSAESYEKNTSSTLLNLSGISKKYKVNLANLTHVFVDVHRDMYSSCDNLRRSNNFDKLSDEEEVIEAMNHLNKRLSLLTPEEDALHWWELRTLKRSFKSHNENVDSATKRTNKKKKRERRFSV